MLQEDLLNYFRRHRGEFCSGEELAALFSVTRSAVWKAVRTLTQAGYMLEGVSNRGYCLPENADVLTAETISDYLEPSAEELRLEVFQTLSSTNNTAKSEAEQGEPEGKVILAANQTFGRGRKGRVFFSPKNTGIYFTLLLRPRIPAADSYLLTTAAAVAVAETVEQLSGRTARIKWVNDVYIGSRKIAGILTEAALSLESGGMDYALVGIGINVKDPEGGFPPELLQTAGSVFDQNPVPDARSRIAAGVLTRFWNIYQKLPDRMYLNEYRNRLMLLGQKVTVLRGDESYPATVTGLTDDCRLQVQKPDGTAEELVSGEISIRM